MSRDIEKSFREKLYECQKHVEKIIVSKTHLSFIMPLSVESYLNLNDVDMSFVDQLIFRFSKLQDTMGEKVFPFILVLSKEEVKKKTFIDILNRLEELEIVDKNHWLKLREIRNDIAHEYSFNSEEVVESITAIYNITDELIDIYKTVVMFCNNKFNFLDLNIE